MENIETPEFREPNKYNKSNKSNNVALSNNTKPSTKKV